MTKLLASPWTSIPIGALLYLISMLLFWKTPAVSIATHERSTTAFTGPSWDFSNPEADQLMTELKSEKGAMVLRSQQLDELAARLNTQRQELATATLAVKKMQDDFDKSIASVQDAEVPNLKKLAKVYADMTPDTAATVMSHLDDTGQERPGRSQARGRHFRASPPFHFPENDAGKMMTAPSLLPCAANQPGRATPDNPNRRSTEAPSAPGDFQELMGQAEQRANDSAGAAVAVSPETQDPQYPASSDPQSAPADSSDDRGDPPPSKTVRPDNPNTMDASTASLLLALLTQTPLAQASAAKEAVNLQVAGSSAAGVTEAAGPVPHAGLSLTETLSGKVEQPAGQDSKDASIAGRIDFQMTAAKPGESVGECSTPPSSPPAKIAGLDALPAIPDPAGTVGPSRPETALSADGAASLVSPDLQGGTPVAISSQRMKSASQKNEIAGSPAQKLPPGHAGSVATARSDQELLGARIRIPADLSDPKESAAQCVILDTSAKGAAPTLTTNVTGGLPSASGCIEQVEKMISREVVLVRQSGAEALAVSLKVDSRTSLFLQLTNHHGQIEASVRFERGDAAALDAHWGQLQESLAHRNVQLLPLQDKPAAISPGSEAVPEFAKNFHDGPQGHHQPPNPAPPEAEPPSDEALKAAVGGSKSKTKAHHYRGWEKWA
jgi:hypothetical protein